MRFKEYLTELLEPAPVDYYNVFNAESDLREYEFFMDDTRYMVTFMNEHAGEWTMEFRTVANDENGYGVGKDRGYGLQHFNSGIQFKVLARVMAYLFAFLEHKKPKVLIFESMKKEESRTSLYARLVEKRKDKFASLGYLVEVEDEVDRKVFKVTRSDQ